MTSVAAGFVDKGWHVPECHVPAAATRRAVPRATWPTLTAPWPWVHGLVDQPRLLLSCQLFGHRRSFFLYTDGWM